MEFALIALKGACDSQTCDSQTCDTVTLTLKSVTFKHVHGILTTWPLAKVGK